MIKPILGTIAAGVIVTLPLTVISTGSGSLQGIQLAEAGSISEKCAQLKDPKERAACIREGRGNEKE